MRYNSLFCLIALCTINNVLCMEKNESKDLMDSQEFINDETLRQELSVDTTKRSIHVLVNMQEKLSLLNNTHPRFMHLSSNSGVYSPPEKENSQLKTALFECLMSIDSVTHLAGDDRGGPLDGLKYTQINTSQLIELFSTPQQPPQCASAQEPAPRTWQQRLFYPATTTALLVGVYVGYYLAKQTAHELS